MKGFIKVILALIIAAIGGAGGSYYMTANHVYDVGSRSMTYAEYGDAFANLNIDKSKYTPASYEQLMSTIDRFNDAEKSFFNFSSKEDLIAEVYDCLNNLVERADKALLVDAYNEASKQEFDPYTPASINAYNEILNTAKEMLTDENVSQKEVDDLIVRLGSLSELLVEKADKTVLATEIDRINETLANYIPISVTEYNLNANSIFELCLDENASQQEVDNAVVRLLDLEQNLILIPDKTKLQEELLRISESLDKYTPNSIDEYNENVVQVIGVNENENATEEDVNQAIIKLDELEGNLILLADKTKLNDNLTRISDALDKYIPKSVTEYNSKITGILTLNEDLNVSQEEVDEAVNQLLEIEKVLIAKPDKSKLISEIARIREALDKYIPLSVSNFNREIVHIEYVVKNENAVADDVTKVLGDLQELEKGMFVKPDKSQLIKDYESFIGLDPNNYKNYDDFKEDTVAVKKVIDDENATKDDVNTASNQLKTAKKNLQTYTKGIYRINMWAYRTTNNHVGNDWYYRRYFNGNEINNGYEVKAAFDSSATVKMKITEDDKEPDVGSNSAKIKLTDGYKTTFYVKVTENRGRYSGYTDTFEVSVEVKMIGRE